MSMHVLLGSKSWNRTVVSYKFLLRIQYVPVQVAAEQMTVAAVIILVLKLVIHVVQNRL